MLVLTNTQWSLWLALVAIGAMVGFLLGKRSGGAGPVRFLYRPVVRGALVGLLLGGVVVFFASRILKF